MISVSNTEAVLKDYYLDVLKEQINTDVSPFYNAIEKTNENVFGKDVRVVVTGGNNHKIVAIGEEGNISTSNNANKYYGITLPLKNLYGTIEITDKVIRASSNSAGAVVSVLNTEMEGLIASAKNSFARMLFSNGSGYICTVLSRTADKTFNVDSAKKYCVGMSVKVKDGDNRSVNATVEFADPEAGIIKLTDNLSSFDLTTTKIYYSCTDDCEIMGLSSIFDGDTLYGYNKSAEPYFKPVTRSIAASALSEGELVDVIDDIAENGGKINMILCSHRTKRKIAQLMSASRRIVNTTDIAAGISSVLINDVPVYADKFCPENRIYFLNTDDFVLSQLCDWSWLENDNGGILMPISKKAAFSACLVKYAELVCKRPCGQGLITLTRGATA